MVWAIIGILVLVAIVDLAKQGIIKTAKDVADSTKEHIEINSLNKDTDKLNSDWENRTKQLNIDIDKSEYVLFHIDNDTSKGIYIYIWPVEGAIGSFQSLNQHNQNVKFSTSPSTWQINYLALKDIHGVYKRNDYCIIECADIPLMFALEDYKKIKEVYQKAKEMTK